MPAYKYSFKAPDYQELKIVADDDSSIGALRIKPSTILWKPANAQKYYSVPIDTFAQWITSAATGAKKTKQ